MRDGFTTAIGPKLVQGLDSKPFGAKRNLRISLFLSVKSLCKSQTELQTELQTVTNRSHRENPIIRPRNPKLESKVWIAKLQVLPFQFGWFWNPQIAFKSAAGSFDNLTVRQPVLS